ncbi:hypothetical protein F4819DRAFT_453320 [Hypoxylon fuscum]|nr:hypothetical protein F4819DRAFT_453320 [Hypoxylon fuscum]
MSQRITLMSMPEEIIEAIGTALRPTLRFYSEDYYANPTLTENHQALENHRALSCLSRVSKELRRITLPILYHTIPSTPAKLLSVLADNPDLASLVKDIDISPNPIPSPIFHPVLEAISSRITLQPSFKESLIHASFSGASHSMRYSAQMALYTLLLPKLRAVTYGVDGMVDDLCLTTIFCGNAHVRADTSAVLPPVLREIRLRSTNTGGFRPILDVDESFFQTAEILQGLSIGWFPRQVQPTLISGLPLKHIDLIDSSIDSTDIIGLLQYTFQLRTLRIIGGYLSCNTDQLANFNIVGNYLRQYGHKLEELVLEPNGLYRSVTKLGSLRELAELKKLKLRQQMIRVQEPTPDESDPDAVEHGAPTLSQVLPVSLEYLHLLLCTEDVENLDDEICELIDPGGEMTKLRYIEMERSQPFTHDATLLGFAEFHDPHQHRVVLTKT